MQVKSWSRINHRASDKLGHGGQFKYTVAYFSMKCGDPHKNCLGETVSMMGHNINLKGIIQKIVLFLAGALKMSISVMLYSVL